MERCNISVLEGQTLKTVEQIEDYELIFKTIDDKEYRMYHEQDCCEHVSIEDINGDLKCLIGTPILSAYESSSSGDDDSEDQEKSSTWTFYRIVTDKGIVVIRWYGTSNGCYSESVDFVAVR